MSIHSMRIDDAHTHSRFSSAACIALFIAAMGGPACAASVVSQRPTAKRASDHSHQRLGTVTIEAARRRRQLKRKINRFICAALGQPFDRSLARRDVPICPAVVGLPRDLGKFVLRHIMRIAADARVPESRTACKVNFFVIASRDPTRLVKEKLAPSFLANAGLLPPRRSRGPVWAVYDTRQLYHSPMLVPVDVVNSAELKFNNPHLAMCGVVDTALRYRFVRSLSAVAVIIDKRQIASGKQITLGQLADYVAMIGLADLRVAGKACGVETILTLFGSAGKSPAGLTIWDRALLRSLYSTDQSSTLQESYMTDRMLRTIFAH